MTGIKTPLTDQCHRDYTIRLWWRKVKSEEVLYRFFQPKAGTNEKAILLAVG